MMRWPLQGVFPLVAATLAAVTSVAAPPELRSLLAMEAPILVPPPGGLVRLPLPAAVRTQCRPDFSDVRLLDRNGHEVPFVVDVARGEPGPSQQQLDATVVEAFREEQRRDDAPPLRRESFVLEVPPDVDAPAGWALVVDAAPRDFVRRVDVRQLRGTDDAVPLVEGRSIFRLSGGSRTGLRLDLPSLVPGRLVVALEGEDAVYLSPTFRFERAREASPPERLEIPLVETARRQERGTTILVLSRPPGIVPERLRLATTSPTFARAVVVRDVLPTGRQIGLGEGTIRRVRDGDPEQSLDVAVRPAHGERLEVEILDQDSPPLAEIRVSAVVREVALVFSLASSATDVPAATLLFGGGRTRLPRYDIAALVYGLDADEPANAPPAMARLGEVTRNVGFDETPVLGFAMRPGRPIDARVFAYRRPISVLPSPSGLSRLRLDVGDLAHARPDLADVRIVDAEGRQWPYLLERDVVTVSEPLMVTRVATEGRRTRYELTPRSQPLRLRGVEVDFEAGFLDRPFTLTATDPEGTTRTLADGRVVKRASAEESLRIPFADARVARLELTIENGDEAPLVVTTVRALCPVSELYLPAPPGDYALLLGDLEAEAPQYEIARARSTLLAVPAVDVRAAPGGANPAFSRSAAAAQRIAEGRLLPRLAVWAVLVLAVVVLTLLTLRVTRRG
jgi:hypothetical protein